MLPSSLILPPPLAIRSQGARWTPMVGNGGQGLRRKVIMSGSVNMTDRLAESMRVIRRGVEPWVASTDILELAMAKRPMFEWLNN
jgi:hypothetical protein